MTMTAVEKTLFGSDYKYLEPIQLKKANITLNALNHKLRRQMLELINNKEKITVTELFIEMRLEQSIASQHLAILRRARIVNTIRDGKFIYYSVNKEKIEDINKIVKSILA
ncbi:MAG: helix-turn-helix transcriptional regulator [Sphingobacteriales bacterium]|jgi:DNA-binding transcriptional ArsR family regulator|nr:MAG: helix-turn-helix transcriptional regulator [Sphingobacteriales bacterium]